MVERPPGQFEFNPVNDQPIVINTSTAQQQCDMMPLAMGIGEIGAWIVYVVGIIGVLLILELSFFFRISMVPDLIRYLMIKSM